MLAHELAYPHVGLQLQDCESEIQQLEHKLSDYRDIIGQQEVMLQVCTVSHRAVLHYMEDCPPTKAQNCQSERWDMLGNGSCSGHTQPYEEV